MNYNIKYNIVVNLPRLEFKVDAGSISQARDKAEKYLCNYLSKHFGSIVSVILSGRQIHDHIWTNEIRYANLLNLGRTN